MGLEGTGRVHVFSVASDAVQLRDFERLAQLLRLDAVGVATSAGPDITVRWWGTRGTALPASVSSLLAGNTPGWIVADLADGALVFAKLTTLSSTRTPVVLQAVGPLLAAPASQDGPVDSGGAPVIEEPSALQAAITELRDDLGFETASLFARGAQGWELLVRQGPARPWHAVLDPAILEGTPEAAEYPDARTIPGVGARLAGLGCASVAMVPVPQGARLILDSSTPSKSGRWIERARPFLSLLSIMAGPAWSAGGALRTYQEIGVLRSVFAAVQDLVRRPGASVSDLLPAVRDAVGAAELFLLSARTADVEVLPAAPGSWPRRLPRELQRWLAPTGEPTLSDEAVHMLSLALGVGSAAVVGAFGREEDEPEVLLAGWQDGLALSPVTMAVVARTVSTARVALQSRRQTVTVLMDRERTRMAYALHDGLVQTVASAVLELEALKKRFERDPEAALSTLVEAKAEIRRSLAELRSVLFDLSRPIDDGEDGEQNGEPLVRQVQDMVRPWRVPTAVTLEGDVGSVPGPLLGVAYAVIREAVTNAAKHAGAGNVDVQMTAANDELMVSVSDGGRGFTFEDERTARRTNHFGLEMLRQRVHEAGGQLTVESRPGRGTQVVARLPIKEGER
jgi:signal transduction histidine kinase